MARQRDYKAEYRARVERERQRGYSGYGEARARRAAGRPLHTDPNSTRVPVHVSTPAGKITTSQSMRTIRGALKAAAASGQTVALKVTARTDDGKWRTRTITSTTGQAGTAVASSAAAGGLQSPGGGGGSDIAGPVQVIAQAGGGGLDPRAVLDLMDAYEDDEDAIYELWAEEY